MKDWQGKVSFLILFSILFSIPLQASFAQTTIGTDETSDNLLQSFFKLFSDFIKLFTEQEQDAILDEIESIVETSRDTDTTGATGTQSDVYEFGPDVKMGSGSATPTGPTGTTGDTGTTGATAATGYTGIQVNAVELIGISDSASECMDTPVCIQEFASDVIVFSDSASITITGVKNDDGEMGGDGSDSGGSGSDSGGSGSDSGGSGSDSGGSGSDSGGSGSDSGGSGSN